MKIPTLPHGSVQIAAATVALLSVVAWFVDPLVITLIGLGSLIWIGVPLLLIAGIQWLIAHLRQRSARPALTLFLAVAAYGGFVGATILASNFVQQCFIDTAKEYPARVGPLLEAYKDSHGTYPKGLDQLQTKPGVPRLLRSSYGYKSDGNNYFFSFPKPGGFLEVWDYDSRSGVWILSD